MSNNRMTDIRHPLYGSRQSRVAILQDLFLDNISAPIAAKQLASVTLSEDATVEDGLNNLWDVIVLSAHYFVAELEKLVDVVVELSQLPSPYLAEMGPLMIHDMQVWQDLPMLGWRLRDAWNMSVRPDSSPKERQKTISDILTTNRFVALLMATEKPIFASFSWFALVTLRNALETPTEQIRPAESLEALIPAAAAWIEILGAKIYRWELEFESGPKVGARGKGGPLWDGKHGFCKERWGLWRKRFGELGKMEPGIPENVKVVAQGAESMMEQIETGLVQ